MPGELPPICDYEGSDYQTSFWEQGDRAYEDQVEAIALQRMLPPGGELLLELGAGAGRNTTRYKGFERIVLLDYSLTQLQQAQARLGRSERYLYVAADVYRLPFAAGLFDAATMIRVIHHMADAPRALQQIRRVLRPGAVFILEFANKQNIKAIARYLLGKQSWSPFTPEPVEFVALNFDFHPKTIRAWLNQSGFRIEKQLTVSHFRMRQFKKALPLSWLVQLDSIAQKTGQLWQLTPSVFVQALAGANGAAADNLAFFACPECQQLLQQAEVALECAGCGRHWGIQDGIYDFRSPLEA
jgi:ubiquinone/menaquinone biosynthesis C-methylase UbiE